MKSDLEFAKTKTTVSVGIDGTVDTTLTPADTYDFITELLESFQGDNVE
jgi:phage antirepressor YoqD-like protein